MKKISESMAEEELNKLLPKIRKLSNQARYKEIQSIVTGCLKKYPGDILLAYFDAVYSAEGDAGTPAQIRVRHKKAAKKLKALLPRLRSVSFQRRASIRNEYYWFSHQPYKQYLLGKELVKRGRPRLVYSQGVGAAELAKKYALEGRRGLSLRWAKTSEKAWLKFFKIDDNWYNSYFFYAAALGYQERFDEMNAAFSEAAKIAKKPKNWSAVIKSRREIEYVLSKVNG
jgi:hypothetical protein